MSEEIEKENKKFSEAILHLDKKYKLQVKMLDLQMEIRRLERQLQSLEDDKAGKSVHDQIQDHFSNPKNRFVSAGEVEEMITSIALAKVFEQFRIIYGG